MRYHCLDDPRNRVIPHIAKGDDAMTDVYKRLAERLDSLPNGFPATESGVELRILKKIFSHEEAEMALKVNLMPETAAAMAQRLGLPVAELEATLATMVKKGQIGSTNLKGQQVYMLFPFVFGIFEFQQPRMDKELAELTEEYAPHLMGTLGKFAPEFMRVVPLNIKIDAEHQVYPYEDLRDVMSRAKSFQVMDCICKKEHGLLGHECAYPLEVCLAFAGSEGAFDKYRMGRVISREEALEILKKADEAGLVHMTYNVQKGQMFVCNCCPCCCGVLRGVKNFNAPHLMAKSNYIAFIDQDACVECGTCAEERCPVAAIEQTGNEYAVKPERCIGCGACVSGCSTSAITLLRKPESQHETPPAHLFDWYIKRAQNRGTSIIIS